METIDDLRVATNPLECENLYRGLRYSLMLICDDPQFDILYSFANEEYHNQAFHYKLIDNLRKSIQEPIRKSRSFDEYNKFLSMNYNRCIELCINACLYSIKFMENGNYNCLMNANIRYQNTLHLKLELFMFLCDVIELNKRNVARDVYLHVLSMAEILVEDLVQFVVKKQLTGKLTEHERKTYACCMHVANKLIACVKQNDIV